MEKIKDNLLVAVFELEKVDSERKIILYILSGVIGILLGYTIQYFYIAQLLGF